MFGMYTRLLYGIKCECCGIAIYALLFMGYAFVISPNSHFKRIALLITSSEFLVNIT